jgi:transcriptional regulator with XRE-family HTH domain
MTRGPYRVRAGRPVGNLGPPSVALVENVTAYRALRRLTQDELAARMTRLGHEMGRSAVSAIEARNRNVNVDELFGLALVLGVTVGQLLDPTGPDHGRQLSLDVGVTSEEGAPRPIAPWLSHLWVASRCVAQLPADDGTEVQFLPFDDLPAAAQRELVRLTTEGAGEADEAPDAESPS